jgi:purine-nucleoside phosphorylase
MSTPHRVKIASIDTGSASNATASAPNGPRGPRRGGGDVSFGRSSVCTQPHSRPDGPTGKGYREADPVTRCDACNPVRQTHPVHTDSDPYVTAAEASEFLRSRLGDHDVVLVLGSGWSTVSSELGSINAELPYSELPHSTQPAVPGHDGVIRSLSVRDARPDGSSLGLLVLAGRTHLYEGGTTASVVHPVRSAVMAGCGTVLLTNAAGSLRDEIGIGRVSLIADHLNLTGANPLCGPPPPNGAGHRFTDLTDLYDSELRGRILATRPNLAEGVYAGLLGASFETPAEIRMLRALGADLVGMSTVLEAIAAHHLGARVVGLSLVSNLAAGMQSTVNHEEVLAVSRAASPVLVETLQHVLSVL